MTNNAETNTSTTEWFAVQATRTWKDDEGWDHMEQVPTFYLSARVQGIVSVDHAERVARAILAHPFAQTNLTVGGHLMTSNAETKTFQPEEHDRMMDYIAEHSPNAETVTNADGSVTVTVRSSAL